MRFGLAANSWPRRLAALRFKVFSVENGPIVRRGPVSKKFCSNWPRRDICDVIGHIIRSGCIQTEFSFPIVRKFQHRHGIICIHGFIL
jgi:hypothetical protein